MSAGQESQLDANQVEQIRRQINRLAEEIAQLSEAELAPAEYYGEFLQRILTALSAPAGAVWVRTAQGNLQLQYQINMRQVGLDRTDTSRKMHDELLRHVAMKGAPGFFAPHSSMGEDGPGNPTDLPMLLAPIIFDKQIAGLVEIWQDPSRSPEAQRGFLQFLVRMASLAASYTRNQQLRQMVGQQQVWVQLESFARQIHGSLNPVEVTYLVANEGRRLVEADRISVATRMSKHPQVQAISGADVVEKRSNLVQLMRKLFLEVMKWGERLVYNGASDDTLPPAVHKALDAYLAESNSKLLVILPLKDEREAKSKQIPRSALMMECFEPTASAEQMLARLEVVGRHSTSALYNAIEHRRIPMRFVWMPLAKLQEGLGGQTRAILTLTGFGVAALILAFIFVQYPLKMEANGTILPKERAWIYSPVEGHITEIKANLVSGTYVNKGQELIRFFDTGLARQLQSLDTEIFQAQNVIQLSGNQPAAQGSDWTFKREEAKITLAAKSRERDLLIQRTGANPRNPGEFTLRAPMSGIILTADFRENLINRFVKPNEPLIRIGKTDADPKQRRLEDWEIELKIPQKHIGQVLDAYNRFPKGTDLEVDFLLVSDPTKTFDGKLRQTGIGFEANPNNDNPSEPQPVVLSWVRIAGDDIPESLLMPTDLLLTGTEVHSRIRCGNRALGYSLFYGIWEFLYEKLVFFF